MSCRLLVCVRPLGCTPCVLFQVRWWYPSNLRRKILTGRCKFPASLKEWRNRRALSLDIGARGYGCLSLRQFALLIIQEEGYTDKPWKEELVVILSGTNDFHFLCRRTRTRMESIDFVCNPSVSFHQCPKTCFVLDIPVNAFDSSIRCRNP